MCIKWVVTPIQIERKIKSTKNRQMKSNCTYLNSENNNLLTDISFHEHPFLCLSTNMIL